MMGFGSTLTPGEPMLPSKTFFVGLPPGSKVVSVDLLSENCEEIAGSYNIRPNPPVFGDEITEVNWNVNMDIYSSTGPYPAKVYEYIGMSQMRKYYLAMIRFSPFSYYPADGKLVLHNSITMRINYKIVEEVSDELLADAVMDDVASECIANYADIAHLYQPTSVPPKGQTYDYVIITTSSLVTSLSLRLPNLENKFRLFCKHYNIVLDNDKLSCQRYTAKYQELLGCELCIMGNKVCVDCWKSFYYSNENVLP